MEKQASDAWNRWANNLIDRKLETVTGALGEALGKARQQVRDENAAAIEQLRTELLAAVETAKAEIVEQLRGEIATAKAAAQHPALGLPPAGWVGTA